MTIWEQLEDWFFDTNLNGGKFTHADVVEHFKVSERRATMMIQCYLEAQRRENSPTLYVVHRTGRTSNTIWVVGVRTIDAKGTSRQFFDDVQTKFLRAVAADLERIAVLNPRAARKCRQIVEAVGEGAMRVLRVAVDGLEDDGGDDGMLV